MQQMISELLECLLITIHLLVTDHPTNNPSLTNRIFSLRFTLSTIKVLWNQELVLGHNYIT